MFMAENFSEKLLFRYNLSKMKWHVVEHDLRYNTFLSDHRLQNINKNKTIQLSKI